jgi:hypothetical protein
MTVTREDAPGQGSFEFGISAPDIEGGRVIIREIVTKLDSLLNDKEGLDVGRATVSAEGKLVSTSTVTSGDRPVLHISLMEPLPTAKVSFLKGDITGFEISEDKIEVLIAGLPDVTMKVVS